MGLTAGPIAPAMPMSDSQSRGPRMPHTMPSLRRLIQHRGGDPRLANADVERLVATLAHHQRRRSSQRRSRDDRQLHRGPSIVLRSSERRRAGERSPSASGPDGSSVELACIDRQYRAHQYVHSVCDVCRGSVFARRMANTAHTWHENHSDGSDAGNVLGVMPGAARHGHRRQPEPVRLAGDDTLDAWIGQCGYRGRFKVPKLDASATNRGDLPGARAYPLEHGLDPCRIEIPHFEAEYDPTRDHVWCSRLRPDPTDGRNLLAGKLSRRIIHCQHQLGCRKQCIVALVHRGSAGVVRHAGNGCLRSEEHTSELQSQSNLVCRLLLEKKTNYTLLRV